ncbi:MAG TPA: ATP-binding cassette domain-containing protein, partial [Rectinemataceae bacterium]
MADLAMEGIRKYYPASDTQANDGAWFNARAGGIHALVGENGAGKTTLMRILYGLEKADSGRIHVGGREVEI